MRITLILDRLNLGGAERHSCDLAQALAARGHQVTLVVLLAGGGLEPHDPRYRLLRFGTRYAASPRLMILLRRHLKAEAPDVIVSVNQRASLLTRIAALALRKPQVVIFHTTDPTGRFARAKSLIFKICVAGVAQLVFVSRRQRDLWTARGLRAKSVAVIRNGVDAIRFAPAKPTARRQARESLGLGEDDIAVFLVARLAPEKNHSLALAAFARLRAMHPQCKLVLVGEGPCHAALRAEVARLALTDQVIFAGAVPDITRLLPAADLGILPSRAVETLSLAALEMMACGLPMILSDIGGAREIVSDGDNGVIVPADDVIALHSALLRLADPATRAKMGQKARARVLRDFSQDDMVAAYERLFLALSSRADVLAVAARRPAPRGGAGGA